MVGVVVVSACAKTLPQSDRPRSADKALDANTGKAAVVVDQASMPKEPTRTAIFVDKKRNETVFSVGVKGGLLGAEANATTKVKFAMSWESTLTLVRHAPGENDQIVFKDNQGETTLNYIEGIEFVGSCSFVASAIGSVSLVGALKVFGNGIENTADMERSLTANAKSGLFPIKPDDNLTELQQRCLKDKDSVTEDLKVLIANNVYLSGDSQQQSGEQKAVASAVQGPEVKAVEVYGHQWNVKPALIEKNGDTLRVAGQLSLHRPLVADKQIHYVIELSKGDMISAKYEGAEGDSDWEKAARQLVNLIATESLIDRSEG